MFKLPHGATAYSKTFTRNVQDGVTYVTNSPSKLGTHTASRRAPSTPKATTPSTPVEQKEAPQDPVTQQGSAEKKSANAISRAFSYCWNGIKAFFSALDQLPLLSWAAEAGILGVLTQKIAKPESQSLGGNQTMWLVPLVPMILLFTKIRKRYAEGAYNEANQAGELADLLNDPMVRMGYASENSSLSYLSDCIRAPGTFLPLNMTRRYQIGRELAVRGEALPEVRAEEPSEVRTSRKL